MNYHIETNPKQIDESRWSNFVVNHPDGTIFQTPDYFRAFEGLQDNYPVLAALVKDGTKEILGVVVAVVYKEGKGLKGYFSRRAIVMGSPLVKGDDPLLMQELLACLNSQLKKRVIYTQFRNMFNMKIYHKSFITNGYSYEEHSDILVNLRKSEEDLWKDVHTRRRNQIKTAEKKWISVKEVFGIEALKEAYAILEEVYKNARLPLLKYQTFENIYNHLAQKKYLRLFAAIFENKTIGIRLLLCFKNMIYDWYAGSYRKYYSKYPNDLLLWKIFLLAKQDGYEVFDFGGAGKPSVYYGVRNYKMKFGGELVNYGRFQKIYNHLVYFPAVVGFWFWKLIKKFDYEKVNSKA